MFSFGKNSISKLEGCHKDLQLILKLAIKRSNVDFGISEGFRSTERQKQLFDEGKSKIDGISRLGKHNYSPSKAADIYVYHPRIEIRRKIVYDKVHLAYLAGVISACANELLDKGDISHNVRWGGNWSMHDGVLLDSSFQDLPHFELL